MRNIIFLGAIAAMTACGYSEDKFGDDLAAESCRVAVLCGIYASEADCPAAEEGGEEGECVNYDSTAAKDCVDGLAAVTECADAMDFINQFPAACGNVCEATDSGM
ncbi:MAG: hypothetical protein EP330_12945 [Deltaproteobacteria bacterium]|nr:MAG: hypothetical protein EP330_12945 [Deltaproteobacteria bacterium]